MSQDQTASAKPFKKVENTNYHFDIYIETKGEETDK